MNQAALKQQVKDKEGAVGTARRELDSERALRAKSENDTALQVKDLDSEKNRLQSLVEEGSSRVQTLESDLAQTKISLTTSQQTLSVMTETDRAKTELTRTLTEELDTQRSLVTDCEKVRIDIEQKLGKTDSDLRVAQEAVGDLKEQVASLSSEKTKTDQVVRDYSARYGTTGADTAAAGGSSVVADRDLTARIVNVRRTDDAVYAEIDAGSRDGVKQGWVLTIGDGSRFIGKLRITSVDVNKAVGTVDLEDAAGRGPVRVGQRVTVHRGQQ
ncbi:MAG: hypothetical protein EXS17_05640 [Phycisphaerales bacterium]|nr:hypothetical protein [Phycisphaerales bacterium]